MLAVIITIMVLELKAPVGDSFASLHPLYETFGAYALSFAFIAIYWVNHHHLMRAARGIDGRVMWANLHLLFWLSLIPFLTAWLGQHRAAIVPTVAYGVVLLLAAGAYTLLTAALVRANGGDSVVARVSGVDAKQVLSLCLYASGIGTAFLNTWISDALYVAVALVWFVPDPRIERELTSGRG